MTHQYLQQQQLQTPQIQNSLGGGADNKTTLWMGEIEHWMDENFLRQVWLQFGENVNVKMIKDKFTGANAGYCFVDFASNASAVKALTTVSGSVIPGTNRIFRLNWATGGGFSDKKDDRGTEFSIFVGDLGPEVNEWMLLSFFQQQYPSCKSAKIITDPMSGISRGYGFINFGEEIEQQRALVEMQGTYCGNRPIRVSTATSKNKFLIQGGNGNGNGGGGGGGGGYPQQSTFQNTPANKYDNDPNNTTVFVGGIAGIGGEEELQSYFQGFGEITSVKIPLGKSCGFIQFAYRESAEMAINQMQNQIIGNSRVRVSWGRPQADKFSSTTYRQQYNNFGGVSNDVYASAPSTTFSSQAQFGSMEPLQEPNSVQYMNERFVSSQENLIERVNVDANNWPEDIYA